VEWRVMVRINAVLRVEFIQLVNGDWMKREMKEHRQGAEQKRHIFESRIVPHLHGVGIHPFLFWIQCLPDSSFRPPRPPMYSPAALPRKPFSPEQRRLHGYDSDAK
jgi:hypothetical protein